MSKTSVKKSQSQSLLISLRNYRLKIQMSSNHSVYYKINLDIAI